MTQAQGIEDKKKKPQPLTIREERLHKLLLENLEAPIPRPYCDLLIAAGYSATVANSAVNRVVGKVREKTGMAQALERAGINNETLAEKVKEGLEATKVVSALVSGGGDNRDAGSMDMDTIDVPDFATRHKYLDTVFKIKGAYAPTQVQAQVESHHTEEVSVFVRWLQVHQRR